MKKSCLVGCLWMGMLLATASAQAANLPGEAAAATHGDETELVEVRAVSVEAGGEAWITDGLPTLIAAESGHGSAASAARSVKLPQRIAAAELKRMLMDLPGTFEIVDVRPPAQYADFSLPGSINADWRTGSLLERFRSTLPSGGAASGIGSLRETDCSREDSFGAGSP